MLTMLVVSAFTTGPRPLDKGAVGLSRDSIVGIVMRAQRADYEGDRAALKRLRSDLAPIPEDKMLASRVLYWRGFALWRRRTQRFQ